jgi:hypothetical protein
MTTALQIAANIFNSTHSTGPTTPAGKARSSKNALRHGMRSELPVVPGELVEDWQEHCDGVLRSLAPAGALERELAERVALCSWRLRRVTRYETGITAVGLDEVEEDVCQAGGRFGPPGQPEPDAIRQHKAEDDLDRKRQEIDEWSGSSRLMQALPDLPDEARVDGGEAYGVLQDVLDAARPYYVKLPDLWGEGFLAGIGIPRGEWQDPYGWDGWAAATLRAGVASVARAVRLDPEWLLAKATEDRRQKQERGEVKARQLGREIKALRRQMQRKEDRLRQRRLLPDANTLGTITRYESHLSRQMLQALHELQRLQATRVGKPVPPPAALDVTVDADTPTPALTAPEGAEAVLENTVCP